MDRISIGTRASKMARAQTTRIIELIAQKTGVIAEACFRDTAGDRNQTSKLDVHGGKGGAFVDELRREIRAGKLRMLMHSLKDVPGNEEAHGLTFGAYLEREPSNDVLVLRPGLSLEDFENDAGNGWKIGTNSVRRAAFVRAFYPKSDVIHFRGALDTRLKKLDTGEMQQLSNGGEVGPADALIVAMSGLIRIDAAERPARVFTMTESLPAACQGIVAVECAHDDWEALSMLRAIDDPTARTCAVAEREVLWILNGHCNSPIAVHAELIDEQINLSALVFGKSGEQVSSKIIASSHAPREAARTVALDLIEKGARSLIEESRPPDR